MLKPVMLQVTELFLLFSCCAFTCSLLHTSWYRPVSCHLREFRPSQEEVTGSLEQGEDNLQYGRAWLNMSF